MLIAAPGDVSRQTDIVIFDGFNNSPLLSEFGAGAYPVETVYATVEVKSALTKDQLRNSLAAIRQIRQMGKRRHYLVPTVRPSSGGLTAAIERRVLKVSPRSYVVAFEQSRFGDTYDTFKQTLRECLDEHDDHVHGICVLEENWSAGRLPYRKPAELFGKEGSALLSLYTAILEHQQNYTVFPVDLEACLNPQAGMD